MPLDWIFDLFSIEASIATNMDINIEKKKKIGGESADLIGFPINRTNFQYFVILRFDIR